MFILRLVVVSLMSLLFFLPVKAAFPADVPGVTSGEILLGGTNAITGVVASACIGVQYGAEAVFEAVNKQGGVHGRQIKYSVLDDAYSPQRALTNARRHVESNNVFALFGGVRYCYGFNCFSLCCGE